MNTIHDALLDARDKSPSRAKFLISLVAPVGLFAKGIWDIQRIFSQNSSVTVEKLDWSAFIQPALAIVIGLATFFVLITQFNADRKMTRNLQRALDYVDGWRCTLPPDSSGP